MDKKLWLKEINENTLDLKSEREAKKIKIDSVAEHKQTNNDNQEEEEDEDILEDIGWKGGSSIDADFKYTPRPNKKPDFITLQVPRKLAAAAAVTSVRCQASSSTQSMIHANFVNSSGGDVRDFAISKSTTWRACCTGVEKKVNEIRSNLANNENIKDLTVHFDGKTLSDFTDNKITSSEKLAILV